MGVAVGISLLSCLQVEIYSTLFRQKAANTKYTNASLVTNGCAVVRLTIDVNQIETVQIQHMEYK